MSARFATSLSLPLENTLMLLDVPVPAVTLAQQVSEIIRLERRVCTAAQQEALQLKKRAAAAEEARCWGHET